MRKMFKIDTSTIDSNKVVLSCEIEDLSEIIPKGQMLVDSDQFAFIYIVEFQNEYMYLQLTETVWESLSIGLKQDLPVVLSNSKQNVELINFPEELGYLLDNIQDNANYGEEMGKRVEKVFLLEV